jgi:hypothetical protein
MDQSCNTFSDMGERIIKQVAMRKKSDKPRVICIGWHKTGTSTLGSALLQLGYSVLGCRLDTYYSLADGCVEKALAIADPFDAVQDVPWAALFRELDDRYPGSRFILTVRDEGAWLKSAKRHFGGTPIPLHGWLYGEARLSGNEQLYLERFRKHNCSVRLYFSGREDQFLELDFAAGDGWKKLCAFLKEPVPSVRFPHENQSPKALRGVKKWRALTAGFCPLPIRSVWFRLRLKVLSLRGVPDPRNRFNNFPMNRIEADKYRGRRGQVWDAREL